MVIFYYFVNRPYGLIAFLLLSLEVNSQTQRPKLLLGVEAGVTSGTQSPFWLTAKDYGQFPSTPNFVQSFFYIHSEYDSLYTTNKKLKPFNFAYGGRIIAQQGQKTKLIIPEAFIKMRFKNWEFYGGRRREIFGLVDSTSSSGSYIWSGNALPMPKVQIHTPGYVSIGKRKSLSYNAGISHGWFGKDSVVQGHWLHQKWLYGRIGKPEANFHFTAGINHQVMWGGYSDILKNISGPYPPTIEGYLAPEPLYSYQYIIFPFLQKIIPPDGSKVPAYDGGLAIGNQLGSVDLSLEINLGKARWLIYKQQPFDFARSLYNLNNIEDGLHGLSISRKDFKLLQNLTFEFFYSKSQGRYRFGKYQDSNYGEVDSYFFHGQYQSWSYQNQIIGNPFILFEHNGQRRFNNRLKYYYINLIGTFNNKLTYSTQHAFSKNFGTYGKSIELNQYSGSVSMVYIINNHQVLKSRLNFDSGQLYDQNIGLYLSWQVQLY